jgi:hypothetical protein
VTTPNRRTSWAAVAAAAVVVIAVSAVAVHRWVGIGDAQISTGGWVALGLGVLFTLALGVGLMALMFFSSRRGYDD